MNDMLPPQVLAMFIPILFITLTALVVICAFLFKYLRRRRLFELYHQERMAAIDKGIEVPPLPDALLLESARIEERSPRRALLKGLIWLFIGLGLALALHEENRREAAFGLIPAGIGLAYLIYYFVELRKLPVITQDKPTQPPQALPAGAKL